ncbi:MAG: 3,4-dihydroxy-2-butanone-4-phosphate synthase [Solirubrobacteraceae bacterium]
MERAVAAIGRGEMIVVVDDEDRENEGDLVMAASSATPAAVNFMATHARGLICAATTAERLAALEVGPMTAHNQDPLGTAFHVSVDHRTRTTGISAAERARTIRALADPDSVATDFTRPGHVFPLAARRGGVLVRDGHTEASVDLCRLAGLPEAAVICEIMRPDGEMARYPELVRFAERHGMPLLTIVDLVAYRRRRASLDRAAGGVDASPDPNAPAGEVPVGRAVSMSVRAA